MGRIPVSLTRIKASSTHQTPLCAGSLLENPPGKNKAPAHRNQDSSCIDGTLPTLRGSTHALREYSSALRGSTHALRKPSHALSELTQTLRELSHALSEPTNALCEPTHALRQPSRVLSGLTRALCRLTQALRQPSHALRELTHALRRPSHALREDSLKKFDFFSILRKLFRRKNRKFGCSSYCFSV